MCNSIRTKSQIIDWTPPVSSLLRVEVATIIIFIYLFFNSSGIVIKYTCKSVFNYQMKLSKVRVKRLCSGVIIAKIWEHLIKHFTPM